MEQFEFNCLGTKTTRAALKINIWLIHVISSFFLKRNWIFSGFHDIK